jgi:signal peptidase
MWTVLLGFILLLALSRFTAFEVLVVRSGSMEPAVSTGGIVVVDRGAQRPSVGSIASFRDLDGTVVTHRVVGMDGTRYITRGDANRTNDVTIRTPTAVYGSVVFALPLLGYLIHLLGQPAPFLILLLGTGGFLIVDAVRTIVRELTRMRRDRGLSNAD